MRDKLAVLNVTNHCNHACVFCSEATDHDGSVVPLGQVAALLDELGRRGYTRINFMGGETTLRKDLFMLLDLARYYGFQLGMATNGIRLADRAFAEQLLSRLTFLELSLVSPNRADYRAVTGRDHQPRLMQALQHIMELRHRLPPPWPLTINVVVCSLNQHAPVGTVELLASMELPPATFVVLVRARRKGHARRRPDLLLDLAATAATFRPALELSRAVGVPTLFRGLPTCGLLEHVGHNYDAVDAVLRPAIAYLNRHPIHDGIDIDAHRDAEGVSGRRMPVCDGCPLAEVCLGLDDDLPDPLEPPCPRSALPTEASVLAALRAGPMGRLLAPTADGSWPPPVD